MKRKKRNYWNKENCMSEALIYNSRSEFKLKSPSAYVRSRKNKWLNEICQHMIVVGNLKKRCIYSYEFSDNSVYVGLTYSLKKRDSERKLKINDAVTQHILKININPILKQLSEYIPIDDAVKLENLYLNKYKNEGWNILNRAKTGSLGFVKLYWNKERCGEEALKYPSKITFMRNSRSAYNSARKNMWLEEITRHMKTPIRKIIWTYDKCKSEALKYPTKKEFSHNSSTAYSTAVKNKWIDDICTHMHKLPYNTIYWTKEKCANVATNYNTRTEFAKKNGSAYFNARKFGWLDEICSHMKILRIKQ